MTSGLWELVLKGVWTTVQLLVFSSLLAAAVSFVVGVLRTHRLWIVRFLAGFYTEVFRGTSALVMIFWVFFVLPPAFGWQLVPMWAGVCSRFLFGCISGRRAPSRCAGRSMRSTRPSRRAGSR